MDGSITRSLLTIQESMWSGLTTKKFRVFPRQHTVEFYQWHLHPVEELIEADAEEVHTPIGDPVSALRTLLDGVFSYRVLQVLTHCQAAQPGCIG